MSVYLKFLRLFLVLIVGVFFLVGCGEDKPKKDDKTDFPSQNEPSSNVENGNNQNSDDSSEDESTNQDNGSSNIYIDRTENYTVIAETLLKKELNIPFNRVSLRITKKAQHAYRLQTRDYDVPTPFVSYLPNTGYIGKDSFEITATDIENPDNTITIKINVDIIKPPLENNKDYTVSYYCDTNKLGRIKNFDIGFYDNELTLLDKLYDDHQDGGDTVFRIIPQYSIKSIYYSSPYSLSSYNQIPTDLEKQDKMFKENYNNLVQLTCNYPSGYLNIIYPIDSNNWYATKPSPREDNSITFSRNDLYFFVSYLSELHSQIYLKSYLKIGDRDESFRKAKLFMEKIFPNGHYTVELLHNFNRETKKWDKTKYAEKFDRENKVYYDLITTLADELTDGNIPKIISKIADNYESYYLSSEKNCLDKTICGTLFPEYTKLLTKNNDFSNGLEYWTKNEKLVEPATGKIEHLPTKNTVTIEYTSNRNNGTDADSSSLDLYQTEQLNGASVDDYFFKLDMNQIYGGAEGGASFSMGINSSGFAGVYICFNANDESLGCIAWSDHLNKFDLAWGPAEHSIESSSTFYNIRQDNVIRRMKPNAKNIAYTVDLSNYLKNKLPEVYKRKNEITSLEYGMFTTEFRNKNNGCYFCEAKLKANEISLFKIK